LLFLSACSFVDEAALPAASGQTAVQTAGQTAGQAAGQATGQQSAAAVPLGSGSFATPGVTDFESTGTVVGQRVERLRNDLLNLQGQIGAADATLQQLRGTARNSAAYYHGLVAAINARLQVGTTPGNPELVQQWNEAQAELERVNLSISQMNLLLNDTAATAALAGYLLEATAATYAVRGGLEEDHRQLAVLEDETSKTAVVIDRLLNELTEDIARASSYVAQERGNLTALSVAIDNGEYMGQSLSALVSGTPVPPPAGGSASYVGSRQALMIVRFDRPNIDYEAILYSAVSQALERRPNAAFDVVAVSPAGGGTQLGTGRARQHAEAVVRSLTNMGLPVDRITVATAVSPQVQVDEVHIYVR